MSEDKEDGDYLDDSDVVYDITSYGADFLVDGLVRRLDDGDIYTPSFQRDFVWSLPQASRFIESILLGLPIPGIFLYREEDTQKYLIIDGLQRLTTIQAFNKGYLPNSEKRFRLKGVKDSLEGSSLDDLTLPDQRRFRNAAIHATIIQQNLPKDNNSAVYHIFERLNTGGTPLQAQEMRAAIYHGPFQDLIEYLNTDENWRKIYGPVNKRAKDQELILRFFALHDSWENYNEPMTRFLNDFMNQNRRIGRKDRANMAALFQDTCGKVVDTLGDKPFRPLRTLNVAVFDSCMVALANNGDANSSTRLKSKYKKLLNDDNYQAAISTGTASEANVKNRIKLAIEYLT